MPEIHANRRAALRTALRERELDALLVVDVSNARYLTGFTGSNVALLVHADRSGPAIARIGAWSPAIGISYVIDRFAGLMLVIASITMIAVLLFATGERARNASSPATRPTATRSPPCSPNTT